MGLDIQSKEVIDKISQDLKVQPSLSIPRELMDKIQLVYGVNPERLIKRLSVATSDDAAEPIFTTSAVKDTFIIAMTLTVAKSVASTSLNTRILGIIFGESSADELLRINYEPVTAGQFSQNLVLPIPIKMQRNTAVTLNNSTGVASIDAGAIIYFYEVDPQ